MLIVSTFRNAQEPLETGCMCRRRHAEIMFMILSVNINHVKYIKLFKFIMN